MKSCLRYLPPMSLLFHLAQGLDLQCSSMHTQEWYWISSCHSISLRCHGQKENLAVINASMLLENAGDAYILPIFAKCNTRPLLSEFIRIH
ncbi:hypothetical protein J3E68DRAFT_279817 [Trichoderma sp. SZMC 28012]